MGLISQFLAAQPASNRRSYGEISSLTDPKDWLMRTFGSVKTAAGVEVNADSALRSSAVFASVRVRSQSFASLPLNVYRNQADGGKVVDKKHPLYSLLHDQPNEWQTSYEWREMGEGHDSLRGNFYCQKVFSRLPNRSGKYPLEQLLPLHPDRVRIERDAQNKLTYVYLQPNGDEKRLSREQVLHVRGFSLDGVYGVSPVAMMMNAIGLAIATEEYGSRFFGQRAVPSGFFKHPNIMGDEAIKSFKDSMAEMFSGVDKSHGIAVLEEGMDFVSVGLKNEEAQFLETRKFQISEIGPRIFGVPAHMIGDLERATFSNIEQQSIEFVTHCLLPIVRRWEQAMTRDLLTEEERKTHSIGFVLEGLLRGDTLSRYQAYAVGRQWGWLSIDDVREREDMNKLPDGKGGDYLEPLNMKVVGQEPPPPEPAHPQMMPQDSPPPADNQTTVRSLEPVFEDVLGRILRKEAGFLEKTARKCAESGDLDAAKREIDHFYSEHRDFVTGVIGPAVGAFNRLTDGPVRYPATYAQRHIAQSEALAHAALLRNEPIKALEELAKDLRSVVTAWGAAKQAIDILNGEDSNHEPQN